MRFQLVGLRRPALLTVAVLAAVLFGQTGAGAAGYEWRDHEAPFDFVFENHIDTHQQSTLTGGSGLRGFLYITPSGETTEERVPIAEHGDCTGNPEGCTVGWLFRGVARTAEYCGHVAGEHPAWAIASRLMPRQPGFTHFHWLDETSHHDGLQVGEQYEGYVLELTAVDTFVFSHHGGYLVTPGIDVETHANVYPTCEDWPHYGEGGGGHDH